MLTEGNLQDAMGPLETEPMNNFARRVKPKHVLAFATGSAVVPTGGFLTHPKIAFIHGEGSLPTASTCSRELVLYVNKTSLDQDEFFLSMVKSLMNGVVFSAL